MAAVAVPFMGQVVGLDAMGQVEVAWLVKW